MWRVARRRPLSWNGVTVFPSGRFVARLTRVEQRQRTHAQLLSAGRHVFLRRGFLAATAQQPDTASLVAAIQQRHDDAVVSLLAEHVQRLGLTPSMPLPQAVVLLGALGIGLALRQAVAPTADAAAILGNVVGMLFLEQQA